MWNGRFKPTRRSLQYLHPSGALQFPPTPQRRLRHRPLRVKQTLVGPAVSCTGVVYDRTAGNVALALTRLTGSREPATFGLCAALYTNQANFVKHVYRPHFERYAAQLSSHPLWVNYLNCLEEEALHFADRHPKRLPRIHAMVTQLREGRQLGTRCWADRVEGKFKVEVAKQNKYPRLVVDLGVPASLIGAWLATCLKRAMAACPWVGPKFHLEFIPDASYRSLKRAFDLLLNCPAEYTFVFFSDDAALAIRTAGGIRYFEIDISSCDKSHGEEVFDLLNDEYPPHLRGQVAYVLGQLKCRLRIRDPEDRRRYVDLDPLHPTLYSGSVLTTIVNNNGSQMIGWSTAHHGATDCKSIQDAAAAAGYLVTVRECPSLFQVQFLKHSAAIDVDGVVQPVVNIGVFLRAIGVTLGELPGSGPLPLRAAAHAAAIASCTWPNTHFPLIDAFRERFGKPCMVTVSRYMEAHPLRDFSWPVLHFTDASVLRRYEFQRDGREYTQGWSQLHRFFHEATVGTITAGPEMDQILDLDYEMKTLPYDEASYEVEFLH